MLLSKLTKRWERVGNDCVMIPEKSMMESEWDEKCWSCIAKSVSAKMLVRRATIDTGRMRQSRVVVRGVRARSARIFNHIPEISL